MLKALIRRQSLTSAWTRKIVLSSIGAAVLTYFLDERHGHRRRAVLRQQVMSGLRHGSKRLVRTLRYARGKAYGVAEETIHLHAPDNPEPDDRTLKSRLESELFRDPAFPKGRINIDVIDGVVELRGQVASAEQIAEIEARVREMAGVWVIESYLHLPGTPAPNKAGSLSAS